MKKLLLVVPVLCLLFVINACKNTQKMNTPAKVAPSLTGSWQLNYITGPRIAFDGLYPEKKPQLIFRDGAAEVSGNSSCNSFSAPITLENNAISFGEPAATMMACPGIGESTFFSTLKKINHYSITEDTTLTLIMGDVAMMRFSRIK